MNRVCFQTPVASPYPKSKVSTLERREKRSLLIYRGRYRYYFMMFRIMMTVFA